MSNETKLYVNLFYETSNLKLKTWN